MRKQTFKILFLLLGVVCLGFLLRPSPTLAANPSTISFQGKVVNSNGTNVADGTYSFVFRIYNASSPTMTTSCTTTATCLWEETQASVSVTNGVFQVELGSACALTSASCNNSTGGPINYSSNSSLYLTMQFNGDTSGTHGGFMFPLIHMDSVPFAFYADNSANSSALGGISSSNFVQLAQGIQTDSSSSNASIAINKTGATANILTLQQTGVSVFTIGNTGNALFRPYTSSDSATFFQIQNAGGASLLVADTSGFDIKIYDSSGANYASISATSNSATFQSNTGTTVVGNGTGSITLNAGAGAAVNITGHANSTWQTDTGGTLTIQGGSTLALLSTTTSAISLDSGTTGNVNVGTGANSKTVNIGAVGTTTTSSTLHIADTSDATGTQAVTIGSDANAANTVDIDAGTGASAIEIGDTNSAHGIKIGAGGTNTAQTIVIGSNTTTNNSSLTLNASNSTTVNDVGVLVGGGFTTGDTNQVNLVLDSSNAFTETASTCTTSVNPGALYFNQNTGSLRACIVGSNSTAGWEDLISTAGLGVIAFGVVPDSPVNLGNQGDLAGIGASGANGSGPCKVYIGSTTATIRWTGCVAYTGGRRVIVAPQTTDATPGKANNGWVHVCLNAASGSGTPSATATMSTNGTEIANLPAFSANNPILCLADISTSNTAVTGIYDVRTFTTTVHDFVNISSSTTVGLGSVVIPSGTNAITAGTATVANILGVVVAWGGATTGTPNAIIATDGPTWAKATAGTAGAVVIPSTGTAGRVFTGTSVTGPYGDLGIQRSATWSATCTAGTASTCQLSDFFDMHLR